MLIHNLLTSLVTSFKHWDHYSRANTLYGLIRQRGRSIIDRRNASVYSPVPPIPGTLDPIGGLNTGTAGEGEI
jgi:hypothetical protein